LLELAKGISFQATFMLVLFVDNTNLMTDGQNSEHKMQEIMSMCDQYYGATGDTIETNKTTYFAWKWH